MNTHPPIGSGAPILSAALQSTELQIPVDSVVLPGELAIPDGAYGLVLFAHGSGSSRFSPRNRAVAEVLHSAGLATLLFDLLTPVEDTHHPINSPARFDIELLSSRLTEVANQIQKLPACRRLNLGFFGASTGGAAALRASVQCDATVGAVVSRGGRPDMAGDALPYVNAPTLLIVGEHDKDVLRLNKLAYAKMRCERALTVVPGATHLFSEPGALEEVARLAADWFRRHLGGLRKNGIRQS